MLKTGEMLIMLVSFFEKVAKTREMLIMLIMLIIWGLTEPPPQPPTTPQRGQFINISPVLSTSWGKCA